MARSLRVQFPGALYHVINRGNYRRDVFETVGAASAFELALGEACERHGGLLYADVVMRNHYHLALETPQLGLVGGMHWLQSTFATRFNRMRSERRHLFQGRFRRAKQKPARPRRMILPPRSAAMAKSSGAAPKRSSLVPPGREPWPDWPDRRADPDRPKIQSA